MSDVATMESPGVEVNELGCEDSEQGGVSESEDAGDGGQIHLEGVATGDEEVSTADTETDETGGSNTKLPEPYFIPGERLKASQVDSARAAAQFLSQDGFVRDGECIVNYWRGSFHVWIAGAYRIKPIEDMEILVDRYLQNHVHHLNSGVVGNVVARLKAQVMASNQRDAPFWLGPTPSPWPADEVIVASNGVFHLPTVAKQLEGDELTAGEPCRMELTPRLFTHTALDFAVDTNASEPERFLKFLGELWSDDPLSIACLQEWFGYLLTTDTSRQKILFIVGPRRSGKGTLTRVLTKLVGLENVASPTFDSLSRPFGLEGLLGKSVAIIHDARLGRSNSGLVTERLLSISGEDALDIDRKYLKALPSVRLPTRIVVVSNEIPRLQDASGALASRFCILRLTNSWIGKEDLGLTDRLFTELPGIFLWAIRGWGRLQKQTYFTKPASSEALVQQMEELASPMKAFVDECCEVGLGREIQADGLYSACKKWREDRGIPGQYDKSHFGRDLMASVPTVKRIRPKVKGKRTYIYSGIGLGEGALGVMTASEKAGAEFVPSPGNFMTDDDEEDEEPGD